MLITELNLKKIELAMASKQFASVIENRPFINLLSALQSNTVPVVEQLSKHMLKNSLSVLTIRL